MSQEYEGWDADARPMVKGLALFLAVLLSLVIGTALVYNHLYAARTRPDPHRFPKPELETVDSAPNDRASTPPLVPPPGIDRAMAKAAAKGDALWEG